MTATVPPDANSAPVRPTPPAPPGQPGPAGDGSLTYEQLVEALEELTRRMADGAIGIEEAVDLYERAGLLHAQATERLARVQARIDRLAGEEAIEERSRPES